MKIAQTAPCCPPGRRAARLQERAVRVGQPAFAGGSLIRPADVPSRASTPAADAPLAFAALLEEGGTGCGEGAHVLSHGPLGLRGGSAPVSR
jgi:hypothetical protein